MPNGETWGEREQMKEQKSKHERGFSFKKPKNEAEALFFEKASAAGWTSTKRGWPDFFCVNDKGEFCCVEVKPTERQRLKRDQIQIMRYLKSAGIRCYKWTPDGGFQSTED